MKKYVDRDKLQEFTTKLVGKLKTMFSSPLVASTVAEMTDTSKVYVYVGSESGYTSGNWYYYNGSAWTSGGVYNAVAVDTDKTLLIADKAADAKAVGDAIGEVEENVNNLTTQLDNAGIDLTNFSILSEVNRSILNDIPGYAIRTTYEGTNMDASITVLSSGSVSEVYPCKAGDKIKFKVYSNSSARIVFCTYLSSGAVNVRIAAGNAGISVHEYQFTNDDVYFRIGHTMSETQRDEFIIYMPQDTTAKGVTNALLETGTVIPEMFGAVGDGVTDDSDKLQAMFDYAYYTSSKISFTANKTYFITKTIILRSYSNNLGYVIEGNNGRLSPNIKMGKAYASVFTGENFPNQTSINLIMCNFSSRTNSDGGQYKTSFMRRITLTNESLMENCKFTGFDIVFEASTLHAVSEIRRCTFWGIKTAFMTNKHRDGTDDYTSGDDLGFLPDSKIINSYISGAFSNFPVIFAGTHMDVDAVIEGCFIESAKYLFAGGYLNGFHGAFFNNCDIQYLFRLFEKGVSSCQFTNCYFSGFSSEKLLNGITWSGITDFISGRNAGLICTDEDAQYKNIESIDFNNVVFDGNIINSCDNFINLNGDSEREGYNFENTLIIEDKTRFTNELANSTRVNIKGAYSKDSYFRLLNHKSVNIEPKNETNGIIENAFVGQFLIYNDEIYYAYISDGRLIYKII